MCFKVDGYGLFIMYIFIFYVLISNGTHILYQESPFDAKYISKFNGVTYSIFLQLFVINGAIFFNLRRDRNYPINICICHFYATITRSVMICSIDNFMVAHKLAIVEIYKILILQKIKMTDIHGYSLLKIKSPTTKAGLYLS